VPAPVDHPGGQVQVRTPAGLPVQLDQRRLDLGMPADAVLAVRAEPLDEQVGEPGGDLDQISIRPGTVGRNRRLDEVAGAVELVAPAQVPPTVDRVVELVPGVEVAVAALRGAEQLGRVVDERLQRVRPARPGRGLERLVDVRVSEPPGRRRAWLGRVSQVPLVASGAQVRELLAANSAEGGADTAVVSATTITQQIACLRVPQHSMYLGDTV